ncbi:DUF6090 family protein [Aquimarina sp. 2201CG14-23]|uniref:DUF6090 family protein n=1 Tax=Aquimarina mycalae TaxID=3040073 RepID=UPI0024781F43|nr:DUF6090 family protein [Aquimarina sp. 2201CG14-23]MDH7446439.1 DUF6090 family protein [Aquimarina sp. 2201CG14-23]
MYKKRVKKYLFYSIGEIFLVVIGILIAVSINSANEIRKKKKNLRNTFVTYKEDLKIDTLSIGSVLKQLEVKKKIFDQFLSDTVTIEMYKKNPQAMGLVLSYAPFELQKKGIRMLEKFEVADTEQTDSLLVQILANHNVFDVLLKETHERIGADISENMEYLKYNHTWIGDLLLGNIDNPDMYEYYVSDTYRARLAIHYMLVYKNLKPILDSYMKSAKDVLDKIEEKTKEY